MSFVWSVLIICHLLRILFHMFGVQSSTGDEAYNPDGLVPRCIRLLKDKFPDLVS